MSIVGIDLGTTVSLLARARGDGPAVVLGTRDGGPGLRSVVHVGADGSTTVGEAAQRLAPLDPESVFAFFKRSMGTSWSVAAGGGRWRPEDLSAAVISALIEDSDADLDGRATTAVVTIPAYFGDDARRATLRAGESAGVEIISLLHEPTAACLSCRGLVGESGTILVYDLGGGTFDVSVVRFQGADAEVLATAGDHRLGGKDWDDLLVDLVAERLEAKLGVDPRDDTGLLAELQERARDAKHALSRVQRTAVTLHVAGGVERVELDRETFWSRGRELFARTEDLVERVLRDIGGASRVDDVLLVGGSTRMPPCREVVAKLTGHQPVAGVNPDEAVVMGAALRARGGPESKGGAGGIGRIRDVTAHALGFVVVSADGTRYVNEVMIPRNASLPAAATKRHELDGGGQRILSVYMLQGEAERPLDAEPVGCWTFADIPVRAGGVTSAVEVSYHYDEDGVVHVAATVDGVPLGAPSIDREDRDLRWTEEDPSERRAPELVVALVIDVSTSMQGRKLEEAKDACAGFIDELQSAGLGDRIAVVSFGSSAARVVAVGVDPQKALGALAVLRVEGSTNMAAGLRVAGEELAGYGCRRVIVLLSDGAPDDRSLAMAERTRLVRTDVELIARGVAGADSAFLSELATGDGELVDAGALAGSFRGIARQLLQAGAIGRSHR